MKITQQQQQQLNLQIGYFSKYNLQTSYDRPKHLDVL
jgi:hypothetical protein